MRRRHFVAFSPVCPVCLRAGRAPPPLVIAHVIAETVPPEAEREEAERERDGEVLAGILHCPLCAHEYPIIDGIPFILPDLRRLFAERGLDILLREDLDPLLESLVGDAIGPDSWFDATRSVVSSYAWDSWADLDPAEVSGDAKPGAARRCLARLLDLAATGVAAPVTRALDLGCGGGRTSFDLAAAQPDALVLGMDLHPGLLRLARRAGSGGAGSGGAGSGGAGSGGAGSGGEGSGREGVGQVSYPRRRIGLVYDRRRFDVARQALPGAERVDFWACDALALPFAAASADLCVALNLLDCVPDPRRLLEALAAVTRPDGRVLLATPYDWSTRATPIEAWLGGHSQRADHRGAGEAFLNVLLGEGGQPHAVDGLARLAEQADWPWRTRLHDRAAVEYRTHLVALRRR